MNADGEAEAAFVAELELFNGKDSLRIARDLKERELKVSFWMLLDDDDFPDEAANIALNQQQAHALSAFLRSMGCG